jgi:hypothetical protein
LKKYLLISLKVIAWIIGSIIGLFLLITILIQIPAIQNFAKNKAVSFLEDKIKTKVEIGKIEIGLPKKIVLENIYFESQQKDTLLAGKKIAVNINLVKLLDNQIEINSLDLEEITTHITRNQDSVFNFDYIIKAFVSEQKKPKTTNKAGMKFSVEKINLDKIKVKFNDAITKNNLNVYLNHFDTDIKKFDLDKMNFSIPKISLNGLNLKLEQGLVEEMANKSVVLADSLTKKPELKIKLGEIDISKINIDYGNSGTGLKTKLDLGKLLVSFNDINLKNQLIDIKKLEWSDTKGALTLGKIVKVVNLVSNKTKPTPASANKWKVKLAESNIKNINFNFDDENSARIKKGIDYKHLALRDFALQVNSFYYSADTISGEIKNASTIEKCGLNIQTLRTNFFYGNNSAYLKNLYLKTPHTILKDRVELKYKSIASLTKYLGKLYIDANINGSKIGVKDIILFVPTLANTNHFKDNLNASLLINSKVKGKINNLNIPQFQISGIGKTKINASGKITGLPDVKKSYFDLNIQNFESTSSDLNLFLPKGTLPQNIRMPEHFGVKGKFKGTINNFSTNLLAISTYGNAKIKATFDQRIKNKEKYQADAELTNFNLGKLLKQEAKMGRISLHAKVNGTGLNPKTATASLKGTILKADYNKYTYHNLNLVGNIAKSVYTISALMKDPNLDFDLKANGSFAGKYPSVKMKLNLDSANLRKLNFYAGDFRIRGKVDADIATADPDYLNGKISLNNILIAKSGERLLLDSINIISTATSSKNTFDMKSPFMMANLNGKYQLTQLGNALTQTISQYYNLKPNKVKKQLSPQNLIFKLAFYNNPTLLKFVPSIKKMETININGRYNSIGDSLILKGTIPKLIYGTNIITNAKLDINTTNKALNYSLLIDEIKNVQILLPRTSLVGTLQNNVLTYKLIVKDKVNKDRYSIAGNLKSANNETEIRLDANGLTLNYQPWAIANDNLIRLGKNGFFANNFSLSNQLQSIKIQSQNINVGSPLALNFNNFKIETITSIVEKDSLLLGGIINGNALLSNLNTNPKFTSDLTIKDFNFKTDTIGDIALKVNNNIANTLAANIMITGKGNQVNLTGLYKTDDKSFDMDLNLQKLNLKSIQGFTFGKVTQSSGYLSGNFKVTGNTSNPKILGDLQFNNGAFRIKPLNSYFKLLNDKISFNNDGILFNKFSLDDSANNKLVVDGIVYTKTYKDFRFNLEVVAQNFRAVNSTQKDNNLYFGQLYLDTRLRIKGDMNKPIIDGSLSVNKQTKFTIILPQSDPSIADRAGIVEFIDKSNMQLAKTFSLPDSLNKTAIKGMDASVNINIDKDAELSIVIDKSNGDFVKIKGEAKLNGGIDPSGKVTLTGRYDLNEGSYELSFNLIKRKFLIKNGSSIIWTGEPTSAIVDLTAVYVANTAPIDLLDNQLSGLNPEVRNTYKQKLPFQVLLNMKGELLLPVLTFDIVLPDGNYNVSTDIINSTKAKLDQLRQQPSELNKQVFALLLLNRFVGENPFASEAGSGGIGSLARQSVSKILSQQLNDLAGNLIEGVDLNFDLQSTDDYTSGQRKNKTDLNVGLSKRLLNDRLKVTVGSNFGLEGTQQANQQTNTIAGDLSVDYQLSKDGRYRLRAYRKNQYQVALQGQVIETGVGFVITMDYNKFKQIFQRAKKKRNK